MRPLKATGKLANRLTILFLLTTGILANWQTVSYAEWSATVPNPIMEYHYTYDKNGNITDIYNAVAVSTSTFTYDEVDRITSAVGPYGTQSYSYDAVGNTVDITPPATNTYDNGNIIDYNGKHIDYDYENRPVKITNADGTITEFAYDYSGERVYKKVSSGTITSEDYYVGNIYEESYSIDSSSPIISASTTTVTYVYAGSIRVAGLTSQATATGTENNTCYYHGDHLGSSSVITDGSGTVVRNISYQPWGNVHSNTEESGATTLDPNHKFTGQILDDSTDLYYYGARYYDPILRRFITPDTIVENPFDPQSLNRYAYVRNNPLIYIDPTGHWRLDNFLRTTVLPIAMVAAAVYLGPAAGWEAYGMLGAAGSAANAALTKGAHFGDVVQAGVTGFFVGAAAGAVASGVNNAVSSLPMSFNGIGLGAGASEFLGAVAAGASGGYVAGAGATLMYGGNWQQANEMGLKGAKIGAVAAGAGKTLEYLYNGMVGFAPDRNPGVGVAEKDLYTSPVKGANNVGTQGTGPGFFSEGGPVSKAANNIYGVNAAGGIHDPIQIFIGRYLGNTMRSVLNVPLMGVAAGLTVPTLIYGPQFGPIITDYFIDQR